jgi:aminoglycoside phosphotransferase (APT) family kinase protein
MSEFVIDQNLVSSLINQQFPQYSHLAIKPVAIGGHDNRTFHLGDKMLVRLPSAEIYAAKVLKEQKWLPFLARNLSLKIPRPIGLGMLSTLYPWHWSIYEWIEGNSANEIDNFDLEKIAFDLANFLKELQSVDIADAPTPGSHNFFRGGDLNIYENEARSAIKKLENVIDCDAAESLLNQALATKWHKKPVWIHGDLAVGNIIIKDQKLAGVIDFSGMAVGDPACDLVIAWTFFKNNSRKIFKENLNFENDTWVRAKGWALWKALIGLVKAIEKGEESEKFLDVIKEIGVL